MESLERNRFALNNGEVWRESMVCWGDFHREKLSIVAQLDEMPGGPSCAARKCDPLFSSGFPKSINLIWKARVHWKARGPNKK